MNNQWLNKIHIILESDTDDLNHLAIACGSDPETFYLGTDLNRSDNELQLLIIPPEPQGTISSNLGVVKDAAVPGDGDEHTEAVMSPLPQKASGEIALDFGTENCRVYARGSGIVLSVPTVAARLKRSRKYTHFGFDALKVAGNDDFEVIRPLSRGKIVNLPAAEAFLQWAVKQSVNPRAFINPVVISPIAKGSTEVNKRGIVNTLYRSGVRKLGTMEKSTASAIGADLNTAHKDGCLILDIGAGSMEFSVIALNSPVYTCSSEYGGDEATNAIVDYLRINGNLLIDWTVANSLKIEYGQPTYYENPSVFRVSGVRASNGIASDVEMNANHVVAALADHIHEIEALIQRGFEATPPDLSEAAYRGIYMTGGGALLRGLDSFLSRRTGFPVKIVPDPLNACVLGCGRVFENPNLKQIAFEEADAFK